MKKMQTLAAVFSIIIAINAYSQTDVTNARQAIDKVRQDFNAAYNRADAETIANLVTEDVIWMPPNETIVTGRETIKMRYANQFTKSSATFELRMDEIIVCGSWGFLRGPYSRIDTPKDDGPPKEITGKYLMVMQLQQDGSWKIARDIYNGDSKP
jgi:uncharacterized protein (TIGR02246 family)